MTPQDRSDQILEVMIKYREHGVWFDDALAKIDAINAEYLAAQSRPHYTLMQRVDNGREAIRASEGRLTVTCAAVRGLLEDLKLFLEGNER